MNKITAGNSPKTNPSNKLNITNTTNEQNISPSQKYINSNTSNTSLTIKFESKTATPVEDHKYQPPNISINNACPSLSSKINLLPSTSSAKPMDNIPVSVASATHSTHHTFQGSLLIYLDIQFNLPLPKQTPTLILYLSLPRKILLVENMR